MLDGSVGSRDGSWVGLEEAPVPGLASAARGTLERIRGDAEGVEEPLRGLLHHLADHLFDPELNVETLLQRRGVRDHSIKTRFHRHLGLPPGGYIEERRLEVAARLMRDAPGLTNGRVADAVGYQENTFLLAFKRRFGATPGQYRRRPPADPDGWERACSRRLGREELAVLRRQLEHRGARSEAAPAGPSREALEALEGDLFAAVWEKLAEAPYADRLELASGRLRFETPALFRWLLERHREEGRDDRLRGIELAGLAVDSLWALRGLRSERELSNLRAEGLAWLGNARRLAADLPGAEAAFSEVAAELAEHPLPPDSLAEVLRLEASLRLFQRRFPEAIGLLERVHSLTLALGDRDALGQVLLSRGAAHWYCGTLEPAIEDFRAAAESLDPGREPYRAVAAHVNLANACAQARRFAEAERGLLRARELAAAIDSRRVRCHLGWVEGLLLHARQRFVEAEERYAATREALIELGDDSHRAVLALDQAALMLELERHGAARRLAAAALPVLRALKLDREGVAALEVLRSALLERRLTAVAVAALRSSLELMSGAPRRPF